MKILVIIRHAKSSWDDFSVRDFDRTLNERGLRDAPVMALRLKKSGIVPDLFLVSPAKRATKTALVFADTFGKTESDLNFDLGIYEASLSKLLEIVSNIDDSNNCVFIFGHNPGLTYLVNFLGNAKIDNIPTCGVFAIQFDCDSWKEIPEQSGSLIFYDFPKKEFG